MNVFERLGRFLVADVAALLAVMATVLVVELAAPAIPVVGPLLVEQVTVVAIVVGFVVWARVMAP